MEKPRELLIQDAVSEYLVYNNIFPASVLYSDNALNSIPSLNITFYSEIDFNDFLKLIDYYSLCDKSGVLLFSDTLTIIISGLIMSLFFENIWKLLEK